jgi:hypothetical protein
MANDLTGNPLIVDTAASTVLTTENLYVKSIRWVAPAAVAGNAVAVKTPAGKMLWESTAAGANYVEEALIEANWETGFQVPTLATGVLYITYG